MKRDYIALIVANPLKKENKMLNYEELKELARKILANSPQGDFEDMEFRCTSAGAPSNKSLKLPEIHRWNKQLYSIGGGDYAYSGGVVLRCRRTEIIDKDENPVYEHENGTLFIFEHWAGCPAQADRGFIKSPSL
jgi:hypothetical protein